MDFVLRLFDTTDFPARWVCGRWTAFHGWLHIVSDLGVWSAYLAIPLVLAYFLLRRGDLPFRRIFLLFGAFILLCGTTHLMEAVIFWWPAYRLAGLLKLLTALISWATVFALVRVVPTVLALRSPKELEREIAARIQAEESLRDVNSRLELRVRERTVELSRANSLINDERERYQTTLASIGDAVVAVDTDGRVTFLNSVARTLTGWTQEEATGKPMTDVMKIVHEQTRLSIENPAAQALAQGVVVGLANHALLIARDGSEMPIEDSAAPIRDAAGKIQGVVVVFRDVTEKRQKEEAIRESEQRFRLMADSIPQMAWTAESNGAIDWYNHRWYDFTGTTQQQMHGWGWQSVHDPAVLPKVMDRWTHSIVTATPFEMVFPLRGKDGRFRQFLTRIEPVKDANGNVTRWFGTNTDVSEAKYAEDQLRESRERLDFALTAAELGQWDLCLLGGEAQRTLRHDQIFGYETLQSKWNYERFLDHVLADDRRNVDEQFEETRISGKPLNIECRIHRSDGVERWIWVKARVLRDSAGQFERLLGVVGDITERKKLENELLQLAADLSSADHRKDEFLATLAHELRNPLAPIRYGLQLMRVVGNDPTAMEELRATMARQLGQLVRLVDDLLDVSRITSNKLELRITNVELANVVSMAIETSRPLIDAAAHEFSVTLPPESVTLEADETRLAQVISNLLNNAAKYTRKNGHIGLSVSRQGDQILISVKDDGVGIRAEMLPKVFEMFTQEDQGLESTQGGLGIGLMLVKRLVEMHGGTVEGHSDGLGKGSKFVVRLPVLKKMEDQIQIAPNDLGENAVIVKRRILVVDDNRDAAKMLQILLSRMGNEIRVAHDGIEAVNTAAEFQPDVILMDIGMPKLNGYEACGRIREQAWSQRVFIIACTGWGQEEDIDRSAEKGFDLHMTKPLDPAALAQILDTIPTSLD